MHTGFNKILNTHTYKQQWGGRTTGKFRQIHKYKIKTQQRGSPTRLKHSSYQPPILQDEHKLTHTHDELF